MPRTYRDFLDKGIEMGIEPAFYSDAEELEYQSRMRRAVLRLREARGAKSGCDSD